MPLRTLIVVSVLLLASPALAQAPANASNVPTVTRLVRIFSELEGSLADKLRAKDASALDALVDPSFEMRVGATPGVPVPRDAWTRAARTAAVPPHIDQMAVHDFGDVAVVSFRERDTTARNTGASDRFVVDCWKRDGDAWKLMVRYVSDASSHGVKAPAAGSTIDKRY